MLIVRTRATCSTAGVSKIGPRKKLMTRAKAEMKGRKRIAADLLKGQVHVPDCAVCMESPVTSAMVLDNLSVRLHVLCAVYVGLCALWLCVRAHACMHAQFAYPFSVCVCVCVQVPCGHMCLCDNCADHKNISITDCPM